MAELGSYNDEDHGSGFYSELPTPPALLGGLRLLEECVALADAVPPDRIQAAEIVALIASVEEEVGIATVKIAEGADKLIEEAIARTRLRPEADRGRKHLAEGIRSQPLGLGAVGIASIEELDTVVGSDGKPFWRAQEYGSDHLVGRVIYGAFGPGNAAPSQSLFRHHPIFDTGADPSYGVEIKRPIPARHFLRTGTAEAVLLRERLFKEIQDSALGAIKAIRASLAGTL